MILNQLKYVLFFFLGFLLGTQTTYAKTELILPQNQVSFSLEQNESFKSLEKEVQPNIGFLKEKSKFGVSEGVSAQNTYNFSERVSKDVANAGDDIPSLIAKWNNLTVTEAKSLYSKLSKTDLLGSKTVISQSEILAEINASSSLFNPYNFAHSIDDIVLSQEALFVRVHNSWNPNRPWLIAIEDFNKFTSQDDMIKKLALPIIGDGGKLVKPVEISIVKVPVGTKVRKSVARPQDWPGQGHQPGGSVQFEIRDQKAKIDWFKSLGNISDYIN